MLCGAAVWRHALQAILANPFLAADGLFNRQLEGFVFARSKREDNFEKTLFDPSGSLPAPCAEIVFIRGHHHQMPMVLVVGAVGGWGGYITKMISDWVIYELREDWVLILKAQVEVGGRANSQIFELEQQKQHHS